MQYQDRHRESSFLILTPPLTIEAASATPITPDPGESGGRGDNCDSILVIIFRTFTSDKLICLNAGCYPKIHINWSSGRFFNSCRILICLSSCILLLQPSLFLGFFVKTTSALLRTNFIIGLQQTPLDICLQYYGVSATVETCFLQFALDMSVNQKISSLKAAPRGYIKAEYRYIPRRLIFLSRKKMLERKYNEQKNG